MNDKMFEANNNKETGKTNVRLKGETTTFSDANVVVNNDEVIKHPFIFVPLDNKDHNMVTNMYEGEPYTGATAYNMDMRVKWLKSIGKDLNSDEMQKYMKEYEYKYIVDKMKSLLQTNINIVLNNGLIPLLLKYAVKGKEYQIRDVFSRYSYSLYSTSEIGNFIKNIFKLDSIYGDVMSMTRIRVCNNLSSDFYTIINEIFMLGYIDIDAMGKDIAAMSDIKNYKDIQGSLYSLSIQYALFIANEDLYKIADMVEISMHSIIMDMVKIAKYKELVPEYMHKKVYTECEF